ncbi:MAG TPA: hypothetical protein VGP59_04780, partial [Pyrinomonadaceae bacterium]|nr:hypothetical protein [Pyrinomonadaceae bacterium]
MGARLDNFAIQLQNQPSAKGAIVSYAPEGDGPGTGKQVLELIKDYLVNTRGLAADRIETIYAGRYLNLYQSHTELWVMPQGAQPPKIVKHTSPVESFQGLYIDEVRHDDFLFEFSEDIEEMGPGIGNSSDASFADILHQQKNAVAYVVVYDGDDLTPGAWRRLGQRDIDKFKEFNVEPSRFKLVLGGHKSLTHIQHWIFPDTAPPPVADVGSEKAFAKTIKAGDFNVYDLTEKNQASIYSRLSEILTLDKTVRAFLIVRLEEPESEEATETVEQSSPAVDLAKLVEKWRVDLATTHKIGPDRLIIVYSSEPSPSTLSLWF